MGINPYEYRSCLYKLWEHIELAFLNQSTPLVWKPPSEDLWVAPDIDMCIMIETRTLW